MAVQTATAPVAARYERPSSGLPLCAKCGTDSLKKFAMFHAGGLSLTEGDTRGIGISLGGSLGLGAARTTAATQTALSAMTQPPAPKKISNWAYIGTLFGLAWIAAGVQSAEASFMIGLGAAVAIASGVHIYRARKFNNEEFPALFQRWDRSYMCERCGGAVVI